MNFDVSTEEIKWLKENFPRLKFYKGTPSVIKGFLAFEWKYQSLNNEKTFPTIKDVYEIEIKLTTNFLSSLPQVKEIGKRIPNSVDFHVNPNGTLCLCPYPDEKIRLPNGFNLKDYFDNLLIPFFYTQSYYEKNKEWAWGEYSHGELGIFEYYIENRGDGKNIDLIKEVLENLKNSSKAYAYPLLLNADKIKGHILCSCELQRKIRDCHNVPFKGLWNLKEDIKKNKIKI